MHTKERATEEMCPQQTGIYLSFGLTGTAGMAARSEKVWIWQYKVYKVFLAHLVHNKALCPNAPILA